MNPLTRMHKSNHGVLWFLVDVLVAVLVGLAAFLFVVARPVSSFIGLVGTSTSWQTRGMVGWFGVRGIGSLYYLMYAIQHGVPEDLALDLVGLTLIAVTLSIIVHGITVKPMMSRFLRHRLQLPGSY